MRILRARRRLAAGSAIALAMTTVTSIVTGFSPASAAGTGEGVSYDKAGCRNDGTVVLPNGNGDFICDDADYTSGNLGKGWNELDLVPFRATVTAGNSAPASQTVTFVVAVDNMDAGRPGYDFLSEPALNTDLSSGGCGTLNVSAEQYASPGMGSADTTLYRVLTITGLQKNATCVYDHYARLALGSHLYPGASLHWNLANDQLGTSGIGSKEISIPVNEILPQELDKTMGAVRDADFTWLLSKDATPANLGFADTCDPAAPRTASVTITLEWTKQAAAASGYTVTTVVTATNPAAREITVQATDRIYAGGSTDTNGVHTGGVLLDTAPGTPVDVPANSSLTVLTHVFSITPAQLATLGVDPDNPSFNDVATATYTDKVTQIPVPGSTFAAASVANSDIGSGSVSGNSIVVTDSESITGTGLDFKVAPVSVGSFTNYDATIADNYVTGPVNWTHTTDSSGSVTFNKTVRVSAATATSGTLSDTASGAFGTSNATANASTTITSSALVDLTINKRRSPVTTEAQTFDFVVKDAGDATVATPSITVPGGTPATTDTSTTVNNLAPGAYTVHETATGPYPAQSASATINLPSCSGSVSFTNSAAPAGAQVEKITVPGGATVWEFTLSGPDVGASGTETINVTANTGFTGFTSALNTDGATYTITETAKAGWDPTTVVGNFGGDPARATTDVTTRTCSFTLDLPDDSGGTFSCSFTNTQRGSITIIKNAIPDDPQDFQYVSTVLNFPLDDDPGDATLPNSRTFANLTPGSYTFREVVPVEGWDLTGRSCESTLGTSTFNSASGTNPTVVIGLAPGDSVTCTYTNTKQGKVRLVKTVNGSPPTGDQAFTFQLRVGASPTLSGTTLESGVANAGNGGLVEFATYLVPGQTYQFCEIIMPGWSSTLGTFVPDSFMPPDGVVPNPNVDNSIVCVNFTVEPGETKVFTVDNSPPPGGRALTIGFWKNWSSCSGGNQDPVLDETLASFVGGGIYIGDLFVNTCTEAVRILDKSAVNNGKKKASDPLYNLASQLLAAQLNFQAGAGKCGAAITAVNTAQALLDQYDFNGTGDYRKKLSKSDYNLANQLAATLDRYNNNLLC